MSFVDTHDNLWMVGGDFNIVQSLFKIAGGHAQPQAALDAFNLILLDCGLEDTGFIRSPYTWTNGYTWRRLDKVVCNSKWFKLFFIFIVCHLNCTASDHSPLLCSCDWKSARRPYRFKFFQAYLKHPMFLDVIRQSWTIQVTSCGMRALQ